MDWLLIGAGLALALANGANDNVKGVVAVRPDSALCEAAATMMERKIGCLSVVESHRRVGIPTEGDFLAMLTNS